MGGIGWYRKRFSAVTIQAAAQVEIVFDGVYMNSDVWLNGVLLGNHPYGYTSFAYDLTPHLKRTGENVIAVRVRNEGKNTRWYSGSGIGTWAITRLLTVSLMGANTPKRSPRGSIGG